MTIGNTKIKTKVKTQNSILNDFFMTKVSNKQSNKQSNNKNNKLVTRRSQKSKKSKKTKEKTLISLKLNTKPITKPLTKPITKPITRKKTVKIISQPKFISNKKHESPKELKTKQSPDINNINTIKNNKTINNINDDNINDDITIRYMSKRFYTKTKTARRLPREPMVKDKFGQFLDDNYKKLLNYDYIKDKDINQWVFDDDTEKCICQNLFKRELPEDCKCYDMEKYKVQGKSSAVIYKLTCSQNPRIMKVIPINYYFIQAIPEVNKYSKKYIYLEMSRSVLEILISKYVEKQLPHNTLKILNSGICKSKLHNKYIYQLMEEASYGSGNNFIQNILNRKYDDVLEIKYEDYRYRIIVSFLLQCVLSIGQLQSSPLEFFHGDYKPDNVFVKPYDRQINKFIKFNINGKEIKVRNMGFIVMVGDFDRASITVQSDVLDKNYRLFSPLVFTPLLRKYVSDLIKQYGDIDPETYSGEIKLNKSILSQLVPKSIDPTATALRSSGIRLFRDLDLYTFFIKLLDNEKMKNYVINKKIDSTLMSFMSRDFRKNLLAMPVKNISFTETASITFDILNKLNEPMAPAITPEYIRTLNILNYKLFRDV